MAVKPGFFLVYIFFKVKARLKNCFYGLRSKEEYEVKGKGGKNEDG